MVMQDKVIIDGIDVTSYRLKWYESEEWGGSIDSLDLELANSVKSILTLTTGMVITITRGFTTSTDEGVFIGQITQVKPETSIIKLVCKNRVYDAVKSAQVKSWDKDIDTEAGVGSEIFKTICDNSQLTYSAASVPTTGTAETDKIVKFIQNDEDDYQKMNELAEIYNRIITYDYDNDEIEFKAKGYTAYPVALTVGTEIPGQIKWKQNMEQLINKVKILGATVYDKVVETFAGPALLFTLTKTPEDTELRINHATTDTLQTRGQKDVGVIGSDFDYYVDVEQKTLNFSANVSDVWINYGAQVPLPIVLKNTTSIETYGGPNKMPHFKKFSYSDIKDKTDAENRGRAILNKYSTPFNEAKNIPVVDAMLIANGNFKPGMIVQIIDGFNDKDITVFIQVVTKAWPHIYDKITVGDQIWRTEYWQSKQMEKINQLFNDLNKNQDILTDVIDLDKTIDYGRRYMYLQKVDITDTFVLGSSSYGLINVTVVTDNIVTTTDQIVQGDNIYKEFVYDDDFEDTSGTATWNTTTKELTFTSGQIIQTKQISLGTTHSYYTVTLGAVTGTLTTEISGDNGSTWESVTLNTRTAFTSSDGTGVLLKITESDSSTAKIENTYKTGGDYDSPSIKVKLE